MIPPNTKEKKLIIQHGHHQTNKPYENLLIEILNEKES